MKHLKYLLEIENRNIIKIVFNDQEVNTFSFPATSNKPKLYLIKDINEILYVGITKQSLRNRLNTGLKAKGKHGYHGYKWRDKVKEVEINVFCFDKSLSEVEAIEAELVYLIRKKTGAWPKYQMEIHFHRVTEEVLADAMNIYTAITK